MPRVFSRCASVLALVLLAGCGAEFENSGAGPHPESEDAGEDIQLATKADSVAMRLYEAAGGPEVWSRLPYLRFHFAVGQSGDRQEVARHLWDRASGRYRVEWQPGPDSSYVALFDAETFSPKAPAGEAYLNGAALDSAQAAQALTHAHRRFINDSYWLLAPVKLFDEGVNRAYAADSSTAATDVLHITFGDVGLTPGDEYWLYADKETGRLQKWAFHLESMPPDAAAPAFAWNGYQTLRAPTGNVRVAVRKDAVGVPRTIYTDSVAIPQQVPDSLFSAEEAVL